MEKKKFRFLEHTADIKFQAFGENLENVFENSALALSKIISENKVRERVNKEINLHIKGADLERLLYDFLEEFLILFETENFLLARIKKLKIKEKSGAYFINCECSGDKAQYYTISEHIKAITYNEMFVKKDKNKYIVQVVVDV